MTNALPAALATILLLGFLGILLWHVPRLDLAGAIAVTLALVLTDLVTTLRRR